MRIRTRRVPLSLGLLLLFVAPFGCTAILGDFDVGPPSTSTEGGTPEAATTSDAPSQETSTPEAGANHFAGAKLVTAGARHTCALTEKNEVFCWGDNADGQLGVPPATVRSDRPVKVNLPPNVKSLVAGAFHNCVVTDGFEAFCWGRNACGQVGAGDDQNPSPQPRKVVAPQGGQPLQFTAIAPGLDHTCAIEAGGATYCWGCNSRGQAGALGIPNSPANPTTNRPLNAGNDKQNAIAVGAGAQHTCVIGSVQARVRCWGSEARGALGDGDPASETTTDAVLAETGAQVTAISLSENHMCAIDANRRAACWGANGSGELGNPDAGAMLDKPGSRIAGGQVLAIAAGGAFTCGIGGDAIARCFGANANGELGRGGPPDTAPHPIPEPVGQPGSPTAELKAKDIAAGREHACAVLETTEVVCWGKGTDGQLGDGTAGGGPRTMPVFVRRP